MGEMTVEEALKLKERLERQLASSGGMTKGAALQAAEQAAELAKFFETSRTVTAGVLDAAQAAQMAASFGRQGGMPLQKVEAFEKSARTFAMRFATGGGRR